MAEQENFQTVLQDVIGLTAAKQNRITTIKGLTTLQDLIKQDEDLLQTQLAKGNIALNLGQLNRLLALQSWGVTQIKTHLRNDAVRVLDFTAEVCHAYIMEMRTSCKRECEADEKSISAIEVQFN